MLKSKFFQPLRRKGRIDSTFNAGDGAKLIENYCSKCGTYMLIIENIGIIFNNDIS